MKFRYVIETINSNGSAETSEQEVEKSEIDLSRARALLDQIGEYDPAVHGPVGSGVSNKTASGDAPERSDPFRMVERWPDRPFEANGRPVKVFLDGRLTVRLRADADSAEIEFLTGPTPTVPGCAKKSSGWVAISTLTAKSSPPPI